MKTMLGGVVAGHEQLRIVMSTVHRSSIPGIVRDGVVVPQTDVKLPDGTHVEIILEPQAITPELRDEIAEWDHASDEAWAMIDQWEADES